MAHLFRYSEWDGTQDIPPLDPDDILAGLTDDLLNFGDLQHALRNLLQRGMRNPLGQRLEGLRDLLQQLRQQRRQQLDRYNLASVFDDIQKKLDEIMTLEHDTLDRRLDEASRQLEGGERPLQAFEEAVKPSGQEQTAEEQKQLAEMLKSVAERKKNTLDSLPEDAGGRIKELQNYEFMDPEAGAKFQELMEMLKNLEIVAPGDELENQYPFRGDEGLDLLQAMKLMENLQDMDDLEKQLEKTQYGGNLDEIDEEKLREMLGEEAAETLNQLKEFLEILEEAGYIRRKGNQWELTPRGVRKIGEKALGEIYAQRKKSDYGKHAQQDKGAGGERADETKRYEFGDQFHLHLGETIMNGVFRDGPQVPVHLTKDDFQVYKSEQLTTTATVLMLDLSWSMALRGSFQAAKKVALALHNLIRTQFPKDSLYLIGFSAYARELKPDELPYVRWDESVLGTNMHHALMMAQKMLSN